MFGQSSRGTAVWLVIVGLALALTLITGEVPAAVAALLMAAYLALAYVVTRRVQVGTLIDALPRPQARSAEIRKWHGGCEARAAYPSFDTDPPADAGPIVEERPGLALQHRRFISLDDDGAPLRDVDVPPGASGGWRASASGSATSGGRYLYEDDKWRVPGTRAARLPLPRAG